MARGSRVVHGAEVQGDLHAHGARTATFISADCDRLQVSCWCHAEVVWVAQFDLRHLGITYSCGRPQCTGPSGHRELGERCVGAGIGQKPRPAVRRTLQPFATTMPSEFEAAIRRDLVREMWREGKNVHQIASRLEVADYVVDDDVLYLQTRGRL